MIFGRLNHFITDDLLEKYDKLFYHGHFCIMRNSSEMNKLFYREYPNVISHKMAFSTRHACYNDENGSIAYAYLFDDISFYYDVKFFNPSYHYYKYMKDGTEHYCEFNQSGLWLYNERERVPTEIMYIHLQKRMMTISVSDVEHPIWIYRCMITDNPKFDHQDKQEELEYNHRLKQRKINRFVNNLLDGGIRYAVYCRLNKIRRDIDFCKIEALQQ